MALSRTNTENHEQRRERVDELAELVQGGEFDHFHELFELTERPVYRYAYRCLDGGSAPTQTVEDVTQEAWLKAIRNISQYDPSRPFLPWLYRIVHNAARDHQRGNTRRGEVLTAEMVDLDAATCDLSPEDKTQQEEGTRELLGAVNGLPRKQREVIIALYWLGLTTSEAADYVGEEVGYVRVMHSRARARLKTMPVPLRLAADAGLATLTVVDPGRHEQNAGEASA